MHLKLHQINWFGVLLILYLIFNRGLNSYSVRIANQIGKCYLCPDFLLLCLLDFVFDFYRPQRSWGKVMFLQVSVILLTGGEYLTHTPEQTTPWEQTPPGADTPQSRHPPGADTPPEQTPPRADTPQEQTPPGSRHPPGADTPQADTTGTKYTPRTKYTHRIKYTPGTKYTPRLVSML